ncbi:MAG: type II toxin-antitoxin system VapC family toxin [Cyanobacteria bacterium J06623_5]
MILVDTSVWIDHFYAGLPTLVKLLQQEKVLIHPFVIGELACGHLQNRQEILGLLHNLPVMPAVNERGALTLIETRSLMGRGVGYIDIHLLASVLIQGKARLWTRDKRLSALAKAMNFSYKPPDMLVDQ